MDDESKGTLGNYAALFIDLLGQRDALRGHGLLPDDHAIAIKQAKETVGVVVGLHKLFFSFYNAYTKSAQFSDLPEPTRSILSSVNRCQIRHQRFSDGLLIYISLAPSSENSPITGLYALLHAAGSLCFVTLAAGHPIRGGLAIAWGLELPPNELYGPVVAAAYELESGVARFPRVVVSGQVSHYLHANKYGPDTHFEDQYTKLVAEYCLGLLKTDSKGVTYIDYLGLPFFEAFTKKTESNEIVSAFKKANDFVSMQYKKWLVENNEKLYRRYEELKEYFDSNHQTWSKEKSQSKR